MATTPVPPNLRVLHLLDHSLPVQDGYAYRSAALLREQVARGWHVSAITSTKHGIAGGATSDEVAGQRYHRTPAAAGAWSRWPVLEQLATVATLRRSVARLLAEIQPQILHAHSPCLTGLAALASGRSAGIPVVYEMRASWEDAAVSHGTTTEGSLRYRVSRALETNVLRRADAVMTISAGLEADIRARGIRADCITVIPNAVDAAAFVPDAARSAALRAQLGLTGLRTLGFIGSFFSWEGLDVLVRAVALLRQRRQDFRLVLVGGGVEDKSLRELVVEQGVRDAVIFTGPVPHAEVRNYYGIMDCMVYPRWANPLTEKVTPLKPLEAMAAGRLVLASDVAGHRELMTDGVHGLLFPAQDPAALAATLARVLDTPDWTAMTGRAREYVRVERSWAASVARYAPVYERLVRERP
jgi:PEP-CTERM/exosortase A-associated glycosyltransferase